MSASCPAPALARFLGAGLHLSQLSHFRGPPQIPNFIIAAAVITVILVATFIALLVREIKHRHAQASLLEQKFRLESLGELTGRVAHDFNNLLFVIMGNLEILRKSTSSPRLDAIQGAAGRSARLTNDLLAFSRGGTSEPMVIELNEHVQKLIESSSERPHQKVLPRPRAGCKRPRKPLVQDFRIWSASWAVRG